MALTTTTKLTSVSNFLSFQKNIRAASAARFLVQIFSTKSPKRRREILIFEVLTTTPARSNKSFILCFYTKSIRARQAKVHLAYLVQCDQHVKIATHLTLRKVLFYGDVFVAAAVVALNSLTVALRRSIFLFIL